MTVSAKEIHSATGISHPRGSANFQRPSATMPRTSICENDSHTNAVITKVSWKVVFHFPNRSAASTCPASTAICRSPVTRNSRPMITAVTHTGAWPSFDMNTNAEHTRILSASGSSNFPSGVTKFSFRAK